MTKTAKSIDDEIGLARACLVERGWKKYSRYNYIELGREEAFIISIIFKRKSKERCLEATIELHSIDLNKISHFMWGYGRDYAGIYVPPRISIGGNINDYRACALFATQRNLTIPFSEIEDHIEECIELSLRLHQQLGNIDSLIELYRKNNHFKGPLMCMYMLKGMYRAVRELLNDDGFTAERGAGDVRYGICLYLNTNQLA